MTNIKKTIVSLLAVCAVGATAATAMTLNHSAFAESQGAAVITASDEVSGSEENPAVAVTGMNIIDKLVVGGNAEMGYKELVYYMTYTPEESGLYDFVHSNPDIGVSDIYSSVDAPYGEWNDDWTIYSIELTANVEYTVVITDYDWMIDLSDYSVGDVYALSSPEMLIIQYASAADGSSAASAIPCAAGETLIVPQGHDPVYYSLNVENNENCYIVVLSGKAQLKKGLYSVVISNNYYGTGSDGVYTICVTPDATEPAEVQIINIAEQSEGSCIVTAIEISAGETKVGGGVWYAYTANGDEKVALSGEVSVDVYVGYTYAGTLYNGNELTLTAGVTYRFYATSYSDESGEVLYGNLDIE